MRKLALLVLFCLLLATPAQATILFAGGEDSDYVGVGGSPRTFTNSGCYDSNFSRSGVAVPSNTGDTYLSTQSLGTLTEFWVHGWHTVGLNCGALTARADSSFFEAVDSGGVVRLRIKPASTATTTALKLYTVNAALSETLLATSVLTVSTQGKFDFYINYAASGTFAVYQDGSLIVSYSGDITTNGQTSLSTIYFGNINDVDNNTSMWSQTVVATTDTRNFSVKTLHPSGAGNATDWTGAYTTIDETTLSDADLISSATDGQKEQWTIPALPAGTYSVQAVVQTARISRTATGPQQLQWNTRSGGTDYNSSSIALTEAFAPYFYVWSTNPDTAAAWTTGELGAAGLNFGVEAKN